MSHVVASWGDNSLGELGDGTTASRSLSRDIAAGGDVVQVAADGTHGLALRSDGTVWAWGRNDHGQLGRGTVSDHEATPARVAVLNHVTKISVGGDFGLALRSDGIVFAWGANQVGQLGNGTTAENHVPVKIVGLSQVTGISAGRDSSLATETNGISAATSVWAWGNNDHGQLGDGTLTGHATPERVAGLPVYIAGISVGGTSSPRSSAPTARSGAGAPTAPASWTSRRPLAVTRPVNSIAAGSGITQISAGGSHMLARKSDGTVLAWGSNGQGQLGHGSLAPVSGPVQVTGLTGATQVAAGLSFSLAIHTVLGFAGQSS